MNRYVLGISAFYHDSAAAIIRNGELIAAAQEERFTRIKHDPSFPSNAIKFCLSQAKIDSSEISNIVFYEKPLKKFLRILNSSIEYFPKSRCFFVSQMKRWLSEKIWTKTNIVKKLKYTNL